ncbi:hypothetical protein BRC61_06250 [Halobacteriales archaeon QH_10_65_19]|jgi:hypothetical protein|nr:MAG: hypothetical protein BRC61_06250 [Halobacteriales archaeon QH_10_65_19]
MATATSTDHSKAARLERYLRRQVEAGECYFKSRFIAEDLEMSAQEIGAAFKKLSERSCRLEVEPWSYSSGTTWRVTLATQE